MFHALCFWPVGVYSRRILHIFIKNHYDKLLIHLTILEAAYTPSYRKSIEEVDMFEKLQSAGIIFLRTIQVSAMEEEIEEQSKGNNQ